MHDELSRLGVSLDAPADVASAYGHRLNTEQFPDNPRVFPASILRGYADRYREQRDADLVDLLASPAYQRLSDYGRRMAIRDVQADAQATADAVYRHPFLEAAHVITWTADDAPLSLYWTGGAL